jgi:hypothetical protein
MSLSNTPNARLKRAWSLVSAASEIPIQRSHRNHQRSLQGRGDPSARTMAQLRGRRVRDAGMGGLVQLTGGSWSPLATYGGPKPSNATTLCWNQGRVPGIDALEQYVYECPTEGFFQMDRIGALTTSYAPLNNERGNNERGPCLSEIPLFRPDFSFRLQPLRRGCFLRASFTIG